MKHLKTNWPAYFGVVVSVVLACVVWTASPAVLRLFKPELLPLEIEAAPGGLHGADLVADLLTISALTISVCIAYICLPSDRLEIRIATYVKLSLSEQLIEEKQFKDYHSSLRAEQRSPSCKLIHGFMIPRAGIGGWHELSDTEIEQVLGRSEWRRFSRYVNDHADEVWIKIHLCGLAFSMAIGFLVLFIRYFGLSVSYFNPFELASVILLLLENVIAGFMLIYLSLGGHTGERSVRSRIKNCVSEVKISVQAFQTSRRNETFDSIAKETPVSGA